MKLATYKVKKITKGRYEYRKFVIIKSIWFKHRDKPWFIYRNDDIKSSRHVTKKDAINDIDLIIENAGL